MASMPRLLRSWLNCSRRIPRGKLRSCMTLTTSSPRRAGERLQVCPTIAFRQPAQLRIALFIGNTGKPGCQLAAVTKPDVPCVLQVPGMLLNSTWWRFSMRRPELSALTACTVSWWRRPCRQVGRDLLCHLPCRILCTAPLIHDTSLTPALHPGSLLRTRTIHAFRPAC